MAEWMSRKLGLGDLFGTSTMEAGVIVAHAVWRRRRKGWWAISTGNSCGRWEVVKDKESKMAKERDWHDKSRFERAASVMYPMHTSKETQRQMKVLSDREGRKSPQQARLEQLKKGGWAKRWWCRRADPAPVEVVRRY
jgi:hypothetical protein